MKKIEIRCATVFVVVFFAMSAFAQKTARGKKAEPDGQPVVEAQAGAAVGPMTYARARKILQTELKTCHGQLRANTIEFTTGEDTKQSADLKSLKQATVTLHSMNGYKYYQLLVGGKNLNWSGGGIFVHIPDASNLYVNLQWDNNPQGLARAQAYAAALNWLSAHARGEDRAEREAEWRDFQQKAAVWRALGTQPPLSDEVKMHRLAAEDAFKEKQFDTAIDEYEAGLEVDPLWPEGHYNAALLYGEDKEYEWAAWHMRAYLELRPNAQDAQAARDQMLLWKEKAQQ